jgi:site-specific DNA recombinase
MKNPKHNQRTAAIYARFSSDHQNDRSIDDQITLCQVYSAREGLNVTHKFSDRAKSGATVFDRDGLWKLMKAAMARKFDVVIVESLDRLSRDQEDLAGLFKRLSFADVELLTVNEGKATSVNVGLRGIMGQMFLKDLGDKIRRHHHGRVREGDIMGCPPYGYRPVPGQPGKCEINLEQAAIVQRVFSEYANGSSPRTIAIGLTRDKISTPSGGEVWSTQSILGGGGKCGMLGNRKYIGEIVYGTHRYIRRPDAEGLVARANPESEHVHASVPHLRIINQDLWDSVQEVRAGRAVKLFGPTGKVTRPVVKRSSHLLSGLLRCGQCNGHMIFASTSRGKQFVACAAAKTKSACAHGKSYDIGLLKQIVVQNFRKNLIAPKRHAEAVRAASAEYMARAKEARVEKQAVETKINRLSVQIARLADAIENSNRPIMELATSIDAKEAERVGLVEKLRLLNAEAPGNVTPLPLVVDVYLETVDMLHGALTADATTPEVVIAFQNLIDCIVVQPTGYREGYVVDVYGRKSAIMGIDLFPAKRSTEEILTGEGVSPAARAAILANQRGQVQRGNTCREVRVEPSTVLFMVKDAL